jgi:hypothetical protein
MSRIALGLTLLLGATAVAPAQTREQKVRGDKEKVEAEGFWIYNDFPRGVAEARKTGKPILVVLRCIPCEECVKLDDDLVNQDARVRPLLDKFVCVRIVSTNGLDLSLFQYDYDQSFAVFLLNADGTIYGRFGTRSHRTNWVGDVSVDGLAKALRAGLELHAGYPKNKDSLAGKRGPAPEFPHPELFPALKERYTSKLNYQGNVVQSCIHCHQIGDAQKQYHRHKPGPFPEAVLFPYPHPKSQGLTLDPKEKATVAAVEKDSPAAAAGFKTGDEILALAGQPLVSMADVQWVLHRTPPEGGAIKAEVRRGGKTEELTLSLPKDWRRRDDISWRVSAWGLRRMTTGGMKLEAVPVDERAKKALPETGTALEAKFVGQYGPHAAAKQAGFQTGDVIVSFEGRTDLSRETDLFTHAVLTRKPGDKIPVTVVRSGKRFDLTLPMQE